MSEEKGGGGDSSQLVNKRENEMKATAAEEQSLGSGRSIANGSEGKLDQQPQQQPVRPYVFVKYVYTVYAKKPHPCNVNVLCV